jgi:hypothetical protein
MAIPKILSIDEFVKQVVIDCYATLPEKGNVIVTCQRESVDIQEGDTIYSLDALYTSEKGANIHYQGPIRIGRRERLDNYGHVIGGVIQKYGIPVEYSSGTVQIERKTVPANVVELYTKGIRKRDMDAGIIASILEVAPNDIVREYYKQYKRDPKMEFNSADLVWFAQKLGMDRDALLDRLQKHYHRINSVAPF